MKYLVVNVGECNVYNKVDIIRMRVIF